MDTETSAQTTQIAGDCPHIRDRPFHLHPTSAAVPIRTYSIPSLCLPVPYSAPWSLAPLRRCSCALRTAGFCFFGTPPPRPAWGPFQKMQRPELGAACLAPSEYCAPNALRIETSLRRAMAVFEQIRAFELIYRSTRPRPWPRPRCWQSLRHPASQRMLARAICALGACRIYCWPSRQAALLPSARPHWSHSADGSGRFMGNMLSLRIYYVKRNMLSLRASMPIAPEMVCDCLRCGHAWVKRVAGRPVRCPKCKQPNWDSPSQGVGRPPKPPANRRSSKRPATKRASKRKAPPKGE
jgi:hypothetical protein